MAPCRRRRRLLRSNSSVLVTVCDHDVGYLVFRFDVKRLFSDEDDDKSKRRSRRCDVLPLPRSPVACFRRPLRYPMDLAASPGGDKIIAATTDGHIMVYDTTRSQYIDHPLRCWKRWPCLALTLSSNRPSSSGAAERRRRDDGVSMLIATGRPDFKNPESPSFETLRLTSVGRLHPLPVPPPLVSVSPPLPANWMAYGNRAQVRSYFVASGRVWLSVGGAARGTYSLDMAAPNIKLGWRHEGTWTLPLVGRAVYAPDLGGLLLGFSLELRALCAIDIDARPPVIRQHWAWCTLLPTEDEGYSSPQDDNLDFGFKGLAYLGGGRLCLSRSSPHQDQGRMILALTAVELTLSNGPAGELLMLLRKLRSRCYRLPPKNQEATVLPVL